MPKPTLFILLVDLLAIAAAVTIYVTTGEEKLGEGSFLTHLSALQLLAVSWLSFQIFRIRNRGVAPVMTLKNARLLWGLIAAGFLFLFADELFKIHENIDELIHSIFKLEESGLTDRIDDLLVFGYALIGIGVIMKYRHEFVIMKGGLPYLILGFVLLFLMIICDVITNRDDLIRNFVDRDLIKVTQTWLSFAEEGFKVLSGGLFVIAFYAGLESAKRQSSSEHGHPGGTGDA
ncbi:MAG: hypothetical protein ACR2RV_08960 [Verrucomicrobiales bacterium]